METVNFVEKFIVYIEDHLRDAIDYDMVLQRLGVEQKSFITIFTSLVGMTPHEYQEKRRMTEMAYELYSGHRRIIDIAKYYGYRDIESFKRAYKESFGISPYETEKYFGSLDLLHRVSFEVVPVDKPRYPAKRQFLESFRIIGIMQKYSLSEYNTGNKYRFAGYLIDNGIIDELLRYNNGRVKGIILHERFVDGEMELTVGVSSTLSAPFEETYTESSDYAIFEADGNAVDTIGDIYEYIFRRWRFKESKELNCNFSVEVLKNTSDIYSENNRVQVWQALYDEY